MKKNDLFVDVSSHNGEDVSGILAQLGTQNAIIKVSESTSYINPYLQGQINTSNPVGFYHFAWFGGDVEEAKREAQYFLDNVPQKVKYLVLDYEDHASGDVQANTDACIAFMDMLKGAGYEPIYYSYKPFTLSNVDYTQIIAKYPNSLWIAGYGVNDGELDYNYFPSMEGIRWWQYSSNPFDKNIVLLDDEDSTTEGWKKSDKGYWYEYADGTYPKEQFKKIKEVWYYFDNSGYMLSNKWKKHSDGYWYWFDNSGQMATGWKNVGGKWYYFQEQGAMKTGWLKDKDKWYYLDPANGDMQTNTFVKGRDGWYFVDNEGVMNTNGTFTTDKDGIIKIQKGETK